MVMRSPIVIAPRSAIAAAASDAATTYMVPGDSVVASKRAWAAFAMTINHSMAWFARHRWWSALFAGVGGPLAYLGAARGFDALAFQRPAWPAIAILSIAWACALPLLVRAAHGPASPHPTSKEATA